MDRAEMLAVDFIYYFDANGMADVLNHLPALSNDIQVDIKADLHHQEHYTALDPESKEACDIFEKV